MAAKVKLVEVLILGAAVVWLTSGCTYMGRWAEIHREQRQRQLQSVPTDDQDLERLRREHEQAESERRLRELDRKQQELERKQQELERAKREADAKAWRLSTP